VVYPALQIVQFKSTVSAPFVTTAWHVIMLVMDEGNCLLSLQTWRIAVYNVYWVNSLRQMTVVYQPQVRAVAIN